MFVLCILKVSVASSVSVMRATQLIKEMESKNSKNSKNKAIKNSSETNGASSGEQQSNTQKISLGVNKSFNKYFAVLEFTAANPAAPPSPK